MDISDRAALLTGATGGLGRAIATGLAERGAKVTVSGRKQEALDELAAALPGEGHRALAADLAEEGAAAALVERAGDVDVLVANAGLPAAGRLETFSDDEVVRALRVNLQSPILMAKHLAPRMSERGIGHMVFIASLSGKTPSPRLSIYSATKFGLRGLAFGLRADLASAGVGVSVISPGYIREAGMFADSGAKPRGLGTSSPEQVASAVIRAIEHNKHEVTVAPVRQRAMAHIALASPRIALRAVNSRTARKTTGEMASGVADKR